MTYVSIIGCSESDRYHVIGFGDEAYEEYIAQDEATQQKWLLFEKFKMQVGMHNMIFVRFVYVDV